MPFSRSRSRRLAAIGASVLATFGSVAFDAKANDKFEIQVYDGAINKPWEVGLEVHTNVTWKGRSTAAYEGEYIADKAFRMTLEPALGITEWFEVGLYLQGYAQPDLGVKWAGVKGRTKFMVPARLGLPVVLGLNVELGRVPHGVEEDGWANEFRPIIGFRNDWVLAVLNPIFGYSLTGPDAWKPHFEPAWKFAVNTQQWFSLGVEYYMGLGLIGRGFDKASDQEHMLLGVIDLATPKGRDDLPLEVNLAFGGGLTDGTDQKLLVKLIVGYSFDLLGSRRTAASARAGAR